MNIKSREVSDSLISNELTCCSHNSVNNIPEPGLHGHFTVSPGNPCDCRWESGCVYTLNRKWKIGHRSFRNLGNNYRRLAADVSCVKPATTSLFHYDANLTVSCIQLPTCKQSMVQWWRRGEYSSPRRRFISIHFKAQKNWKAASFSLETWAWIHSFYEQAQRKLKLNQWCASKLV